MFWGAFRPKKCPVLILGPTPLRAMNRCLVDLNTRHLRWIWPTQKFKKTASTEKSMKEPRSLGALPCHFHPFHAFWKRNNIKFLFIKICILASVKWFQGFRQKPFVEVFVWLFFFRVPTSNAKNAFKKTHTHTHWIFFLTRWTQSTILNVW